MLLSLYPDSGETYQYLFDTAKTFETEKNYEEAIKRYSMVLNSKNLELQAVSQKSLGDCYYNLGKYKESSVEYLKLIYLYPQYTNLCAEAQFMVGKCCENLKLLDEAKKAYNNSIKNYPGTLWAQEAEQQLKFFK
jgi:TolA-binding protein